MEVHSDNAYEPSAKKIIIIYFSLFKRNSENELRFNSKYDAIVYSELAAANLFRQCIHSMKRTARR